MQDLPKALQTTLQRVRENTRHYTRGVLTLALSYGGRAELTDAIAESPLGGMLAMVGGKKALDPLKEPVTEKLKSIIVELAANNQTGDRQSDVTAMLINQVEQIIDSRLAELTPEKVKEIVQEMIRSHLGWLVVWGGVFGGLIGLVVTLVQSAK